MRGLALALLPLLAPPLLAQNGPAARPAPRAAVPPPVPQQAPPDGGTSEVLQSIFVPPLPDAPFTLTLATEWVRPLGADGNTVTLVNERKIARDRQGRIYEERVLLAPPGTEAQNRTNWLQIADPARHSYLNCSVPTRVCHTLPYGPPTAPPDLTPGTEKFQGATRQRVSLGKDIVLGQEVTGMRVTTVIDAGAFGNARPVTVEREFWYSPALGLNLRSTRDDPRSGKQTFTVKQLSLDEPDASLFLPPAGYTLADDKPSAQP